jgi:regulator of protease activity HflC (stomatin/prohibitin superfamily)
MTVAVDAVLFWMVHDAQKAALEVQEYAQAVSWAAQTALRDIIGRTALTDLLRGREKIEAELQALIDQRSNPWGVTVSSVEMRDVVIPVALQDAMSREAQAAREQRRRVDGHGRPDGRRGAATAATRGRRRSAMTHLSVAAMLAIVGALAYIVVGGQLEIAGAVAVSLGLMAYRRRL